MVTARVRPGHHVTLLDVSAGGALIESACRLLPGTAIELLVETAQHRAWVRGRVLRCAVIGVCSTLVRYRGAVGFEDRLPWLMTGNPVPAWVTPGDDRGAATQRSER